MPALCDAGVVTRDVSCHLFCIPPGAQLWIQIQLLAQIAGISGDPQALSRQIAAFNIPQGLNHQVQASLLCQIARNAGSDVQCTAQWLMDNARCTNPSPTLSMTRQTEAFCVLAQCDETALTAMARCSHCIPAGLQERVKTFLLATIAGGSMDPDTLVNESVDLARVPPGFFPMIEATLAQAWSSSGITCGTPTQAIVISGAGGGFGDGTYIQVTPTHWTQTLAVQYGLDFDGVNWNLTVFGLPQYQAVVFPCTWITIPFGGLPPAPSGHYVDPLVYAPASGITNWVDIGGPASGDLTTFLDNANVATVTTIDISGQGIGSLTGITDYPMLTTVDLSDNSLTSTTVDQVLCGLDAVGNINGTVDLSGQTPPAVPSATGLACAANLVGKGWTVTYDTSMLVVMDDGTGTFWQLVVDTLGNVGTTSHAGPATADVILDDGGGGFWKLIVDTLGNRGATTDPGPATVAPVLDDGTATLWTIHVDTSGNIYATS